MFETPFGMITRTWDTSVKIVRRVEPSHAFLSSAWYMAPYGIRRGAVTDASVDVGWKVLL
jgi:hypothetical protein